MKKQLLPVLLLAAIAGSAQQTSSNFQYLDINQVKAGVWSRNLMHYDSTGNSSAYEVPKGSGLHTNAGSALWISGHDANYQLKSACQLDPSAGRDFWPGPLNTIDASITQSVSTAWDRVWKVSSAEINNFITNHVTTPDILSWPGNGNPALYQDAVLAPYVDVNADGYYNPADGDYPRIKGDQAIFYIVNDNLAVHAASLGVPVGAEVQVMAYAYNCPQLLSNYPALAYTTFYDYKIIDRSPFRLYHAYVSLWNDAHIGYPGDDFIGCDILRGLGYVYNGDAFDETTSQGAGYGAYPPAQGVLTLQGPLADTNDHVDNNMNGMVDEIGERIQMTQFDYFNDSLSGSAIGMMQPSNATQFRNYQVGYWKDGTPVTCGGNGYGDSIRTGYVYPDNSYPMGVCGSGWTEAASGNVPGYRNFIMSYGPFTLLSGVTQELEYAFITSFDSTSAGNPLGSVAKLKTDADNILQFYNTQNASPCNAGTTTMGIHEMDDKVQFGLYPNPAASVLNVSCSLKSQDTMKYIVSDVLGNTMLNGETSAGADFSVNVSGLSPGVYFIALQVNGHSSVKKFVKT